MADLCRPGADGSSAKHHLQPRFEYVWENWHIGRGCNCCRISALYLLPVGLGGSDLRYKKRDFISSSVIWPSSGQGMNSGFICSPLGVFPEWKKLIKSVSDHCTRSPAGVRFRAGGASERPGKDPPEKLGPWQPMQASARYLPCSRVTPCVTDASGR